MVDFIEYMSITVCMSKIHLLLVFFAALVAVPAQAHPGRLDSNGGHWDHKSGTYHRHR